MLLILFYTCMSQESTNYFVENLNETDLELFQNKTTDDDDDDGMNKERSLVLICMIILIITILAFTIIKAQERILFTDFILPRNANIRIFPYEHILPVTHKPLADFSEIILEKNDSCLDIEYEDEKIYLITINDSKNNLIIISEEDQCAICMEQFLDEKNSVLKLNKCNHLFHKDCIRKWTLDNQTCPICRTNINKSE